MYTFKLEHLLNYRRYQEEVLQKELADLRSGLAKGKKKLRDLRNRKHNYLQQLQKNQKAGRSASEIQLYLHFVEYLTKKVDEQYQCVHIAERCVNIKRQDLIEAMKKRKTLNKLKEKSRHTHQKKWLKKERDFIDEVAGQQFLLKR